MNWKVESVPALKGFTIEWAEYGNYYLSKRNRLYHSTDLDHPFDHVATITGPGWKQAAATFRLGQRLLRFLVTNVIPLPNGDLFVTFDKSIGIVRNGAYSQLRGLVRPCRVLRSACAIDAGGDVYFGEYLANDEREQMRIYRYTPGGDELHVAYTFPAKAIKHIHGLYFDGSSNSVFCLTGDNESECRILRSSDGFNTVEVIGEGDETWRAVSILFDEKSFYYGTDAEFRPNNIYRVDRESLDRTNLGEVSGTVFYSKRVGDDLFFATTAENAPSQKENVAAIWHIDKDGNCSEIVKFTKDLWHPTLFMFGTIHFPTANKLSDELYFSVVGVREDEQVFRLKREAVI